jgi:hypothetical protein
MSKETDEKKLERSMREVVCQGLYYRLKRGEKNRDRKS